MDVKLPLLWGIDFNVDPMCSLVAQHWQGTFWVLDEIVLRHATTEEACRCFCERYGQHKGEVVIYADASGNSRRTSGASDLNILRGYLGGRKVRFDDRTPDRNPAVRDRIGMVNGKLKSAAGDVRLLVDPKCKELIKDFEQVGYKEDSNEVDKGKDRKRTHMSDALGYILWGETAAQGGQVRFGEQSRPLV